MKVVLWFICLFAAIGITSWVIVIIWDFIAEWNSLIGIAAKIKFRTFVSFYNLNPDRWNLGKYGADYRKDINCYYSYTEEFRFSFIDTLKYKIFLIKDNKQKARVKDAKALSNLIKHVQEDINKVEKQADNEREEARKIFISMVK